jgi:uncharacterized membrane protein YphA (DoxX/SURF4 family)
MSTQIDDRPRLAPDMTERGITTQGAPVETGRAAVAHSSLAARSALAPGVAQRPNLVLAGLQLVLGYEWLVSGVDKLLYRSFPATLGQLLGGVLRGGTLPAPFADLLRGVVLPNGSFFGLLVEWGETLAGAGLLAAGLAALVASPMEHRLPPVAAGWVAFGQRFVEWLAPVAAAGAGVLGASFYLLNGAPAAWFTPSVAFGGALDTGLLLALASLVLLVEPARAWLWRRAHAPRARYQTAGPNASTERKP